MCISFEFLSNELYGRTAAIMDVAAVRAQAVAGPSLRPALRFAVGSWSQRARKNEFFCWRHCILRACGQVKPGKQKASCSSSLELSHRDCGGVSVSAATYAPV